MFVKLTRNRHNLLDNPLRSPISIYARSRRHRLRTTKRSTGVCRPLGEPILRHLLCDDFTPTRLKGKGILEMSCFLQTVFSEEFRRFRNSSINVEDWIIADRSLQKMRAQ